MSRRMHGVLKQPLYARQFSVLLFQLLLVFKSNFQRVFLDFLSFKKLLLWNVLGSSTRKNANAKLFLSFLTLLCWFCVIKITKPTNFQRKTFACSEAKFFFQMSFFILGKPCFLFGIKGKSSAFGFHLWFILFSFLCFTFSISNFNSCVQQSFQNDRARSFCFEFSLRFCKLIFK